MSWPAIRLSVLGVVAGAGLAAGAAMREAPNANASPANQLAVAGNACGPAALLNAFRCGSASWQRAAGLIAGNTDRERILTIIRGSGMHPSRNIPGRTRWSRAGVNIADLQDIANDLIRGQYLPQLNDDVFFLQPRETPEKLLHRIHHRLSDSLSRGFPPILSIRRHVWRSHRGHAPQWTIVDAHFVTVTAVPRRITRHDVSFPISYIDPWGGKSAQGTIRIPEQPVLANPDGVSTCLEASFPQANVGKKFIRRNERSVIVAAAAIGRW